MVKTDACAYREKYPCASQQNIASVSPVYGINLSLSRQRNGGIPGDKRKEIENKTCQSVKWMKGVTLEDL
jgi:hypothetical protein